MTLSRGRKEVLNYRQAIRKLSKQIGTGLNTTKRQDKLHEIVKDEILPSQDEIKSMLKEGDIALGFSAFDITQATMMGTLASHGENLLAGIGTGVISLTVSLIQSLREDRKIIKEHPFGYLYQANRKFGVKK